MVTNMLPRRSARTCPPGPHPLRDALDDRGAVALDQHVGGGGLLLGLAGGLLLARRQYLGLPAAGPVHGDALAAQLPGQQVGALHVVLGGAVREVDRLRDGRVDALLERRLHPHVHLRRDVGRPSRTAAWPSRARRPAPSGSRPTRGTPSGRRCRSRLPAPPPRTARRRRSGSRRPVCCACGSSARTAARCRWSTRRSSIWCRSARRSAGRRCAS